MSGLVLRQHEHGHPMKPNIRLLRRIQKAILAHPDQFNMDWWFQSRASNGAPAGGCGTAGCIAGWAFFLTKKHKTLRETELNTYNIDKTEIGAKLLRIPLTRSDHFDRNHPLFFVKDWPIKFRAAYHNAKTPSGAAKAAARRIDHFIKTGE